MTLVNTSNVTTSNGIDIFPFPLKFANDATIVLHETVRLTNGYPIINTDASVGIVFGNTQINNQIISVPAFTLSGVSLNNPGGIVNTQFFTANGTWTKPDNLAGDEQVFVMLWGGGGGGGFRHFTSGAGGSISHDAYSCAGGAAFVMAMFRVSDLSNTQAVVVGRGGNTSASNGSTKQGGNSTFVNAIACGSPGINNETTVSRGGAGQLGFFTTLVSNGGGPLGGADDGANNGTASTFGGGGGSNNGGPSIFGGGGGGSGQGIDTTIAHGIGGNSIYGGAGGSCQDNIGFSVFAGTVGMGGGWSNSQTAVNGSAGAVRVWVIK